MESYPSYCPSSLSQGTSQINEHNHFKQVEAESPETVMEIRKPIDILDLYGSLLRKEKLPYRTPFVYEPGYIQN